MNYLELLDLIKSANVNVNENDVDISQIGEIMNKLIREKEIENKVLGSLGEPGTVNKTGRGLYYRYRKSLAKGIQKDIVRKTRSEVIRAAYDILWDTKSKAMTVGDVFEEWYKIRQVTKCFKTYSKDLSDWNTHLKSSKLAGMRIADVKVENILEALQIICGDHSITRTSFNAVLTILRAIWAKAVADGIIDLNIVKQMDFKGLKQDTKQPKSEIQKKKEVFTVEEVRKIREYLWGKDRDTYEQAILFHSYIGIRIGELRAITWEDYDPATGKLSLNHEIVKKKVGSKNYVDVDVPHTKGYAVEGQREFTLPTPCQEILDQMREVNGDKHYVFNSSGEYPINPNHYNEHLKVICDSVGIRYFSSHKFRFRWITNAYQHKINEVSIQKIAGHAELAMTQKYRCDDADEISLTAMDEICGYTKNVENKG